ncbi:hypothetical protein SKAU_G00317850 [Synaphobranchus kaupii]|uniref:Uncharacterized protein n=1 Tax=Synaphobranchus kaupii TaxID=118154 RepID=A0A9Q1IKY8_SYNKA|nr:hypothetical protein SKAU_G00317850 [Synaphobranchus kaupii]
MWELGRKASLEQHQGPHWDPCLGPNTRRLTCSPTAYPGRTVTITIASLLTGVPPLPPNAGRGAGGVGAGDDRRM